jgi:hypothetical protein
MQYDSPMLWSWRILIASLALATAAPASAQEPVTLAPSSPADTDRRMSFPAFLAVSQGLSLGMAGATLWSPPLIGLNEVSVAGLVVFEAGAEPSSPVVLAIAGIGTFNLIWGDNLDDSDLFLVNYGAWSALFLASWVLGPKDASGDGEQSDLRLSVGPGRLALGFRF